MNEKRIHELYGMERKTGITEKLEGIPCEVIKKYYPVDKTDGKWAWYKAYRFTVPGWEECTITGRAAAERVIRGRTDPAVLNTLGINPYADAKGRVSVIDTIRLHHKEAERRQTLPVGDAKRRTPEHDI